VKYRGGFYPASGNIEVISMSYRLPPFFNKCKFLRTPKIILEVYSRKKKVCKPWYRLRVHKYNQCERVSGHMNKRIDLYIYREYICQLRFSLCVLY
jgi:hypothetical protein